MSVTSVLLELVEVGGVLWVEGDDVMLRAPTQTLDWDLIQAARAKRKPLRALVLAGAVLPAASSAATAAVGSRGAAGEAFDSAESANRAAHANVLRMVTAFRRYGHLVGELDPLRLDGPQDTSLAGLCARVP